MNCAIHNETPATAFCRTCGKAMCAQCTREVKGVIYCEGGGGGWLMTEKQFGDYELRLEYKMTKGGNSGVTLRCPREPPKRLTGIKAEPSNVAYEIQLVDDENSPAGKDPLRCTGSIYGMCHVYKQLVKPDTWFTYELEVRDDVWRGRIVSVTQLGDDLRIDLEPGPSGRLSGKDAA